jgi:hsp70-interacting protein
MSTSSGSGGGNQPFAWLGLLKWSLQYSDGTSNEKPAPMSPEDRAFLDKVMREGIIDENERMKVILEQVTNAFEIWIARVDDSNSNEQQAVEPDVDKLIDLLQELRDIVEQIDYARAFCSLKGLPFLLGCISEQKAIPTSIRASCLGILATLCQNNPPVQVLLLELGSLKVLSDLFFSDPDDMIRTRVVQAASANVRSHDQAEEIFCQLPQSVPLIEAGLQDSEPFALRQRTLFFLRALITSDTSTASRVHQFESCVTYVMQHYLLESSPQELREMALALVNQLLEQGMDINCCLRHKDQVLILADQRLTALRGETSDERDFYVEREEWEQLLVNMNRAGDHTLQNEPVQAAPEVTAPVLMIEQNPCGLPQ